MSVEDMKMQCVPSKKYQSKLSIINPLIKICNAFCIIPPHTFENNSEEYSFGFKFYVCCILVILLSSYIYHVYGKIQGEVFAFITSTVNIIDHVAMFGLIVNNVLTVVIAGFLKGKKFKSLLNNLERFDSNINLETEKRHYKFYWALTLVHLATFGTLIADALTWTLTLGVELYQFYIPRSILWYQFNLALFLIYWLTYEIKLRFESLNIVIWQALKGHRGGLYRTELNVYTVFNVQIKEYDHMPVDYNVLKSIRIWYNDLSGIVNDFNSIFGITLLVSVLFNIAVVVLLTQLIMEYAIFQHGYFGVSLVIGSLSWITAALLQTLLVASAGEGLEKEAERIVSLSYILLNDVSTIPRNENEKSLKEDLLLIAELAVGTQPHISAAGFFEVDYGMMGFIIASITSYIIVAIQL